MWSALLLRGHLLELGLAHVGLRLLAFALALELGAHELALLLRPGRHPSPPSPPPRAGHLSTGWDAGRRGRGVTDPQSLAAVSQPRFAAPRISGTATTSPATVPT